MSLIYKPRIDIDNLAASLHYHRTKSNLKVKEVAKYLNICPTNYMLFETGDMYLTIPMLDILAQLYLTPVGTLLYSQVPEYKKLHSGYYDN